MPPPENPTDPQVQFESALASHPILSKPELTNTRSSLLRVKPEAQQLFLELFLNPQGGKVMDNIDHMAISKLLNSRGYKELVTGLLFELFCYQFLRQELRAGQFIIVPATLTDICKKLHPKKAIIPHYGLNEVIEGLSYPDILKLEDSGDRLNIAGAYECKMGEGNDTARQRAQAFFSGFDLGNTLRLREPGGNEELGKILSGFGLPNKPVFLPQEKLNYIVPEGIGIGWLNRIEVPISNQSFRQVAYALIADIQISN